MSSKRITIKTLLLALLTLLVLPMSAQVDNEDLLDDKDSTQDDTAAVVLTVHHNDSLSWPKNVQEGIDELLRDEMFNTSQVGLLIWDLDADSAIYRYNDRQALASCFHDESHHRHHRPRPAGRQLSVQD